VAYAIVPRQGLDFGLDGDVPRFWFGNDPFKTRFFDAMSTLFPEGERFFIACVRDYRDQIQDPLLLQQVKDFTRQEAQHGLVHSQFNDRLAAQGVRVDRIEARARATFAFLRRVMPKTFTLGQTAAAEHLTAIMAHGFFERTDVFAEADPRLRALYMWHGVEEIEHKAVAFDVFQKVARGSYAMRVFTMLYLSMMFPLHVFKIMGRILKRDGFNFRQRLGIWCRGLVWLYGRNGLYRPLMGHYFAYYRPGYHPWQMGQMKSYSDWLEAFQASGDPVAAGSAVHARRP